MLGRTGAALAIGMLLSAPAGAAPTPPTPSFGASCDAFAAYDSQDTCDPTAKPGTVDFKNLILGSYSSTGDYGITRACNIGGTSEHKEGRAWDWKVNYYNAAQRDIAETVIDWLLATDQHGNACALARRTGIMYLIWNNKVWGAYRSPNGSCASAGWKTYTGSNPHTDHVHISWSWPGAKKQTTWWTGKLSEPAPGCVKGAVSGAENEIFKDMPPSAFGYSSAISLYKAGITSGCQKSPLLYCPNCELTRGQAVTMLVRAAGISTANPPATPTFSDVPKTHVFYASVEAAVKSGITSGCGSGKFCPDDATTRGQMAAFVTRARGWSPTKPATPTFPVDVPTTHLFYGAIETLAAKCVTSGCGTGKYCPDANITRAQAAIFIARAWDLDNANACFDESPPAGGTGGSSGETSSGETGEGEGVSGAGGDDPGAGGAGGGPSSGGASGQGGTSGSAAGGDGWGGDGSGWSGGAGAGAADPACTGEECAHGDASGDDAGCACRVQARGRQDGWAALAGLLALVIARRRARTSSRI
jgi:hypothetical protein